MWIVLSSLNSTSTINNEINNDFNEMCQTKRMGLATAVTGCRRRGGACCAATGGDARGGVGPADGDGRG